MRARSRRYIARPVGCAFLGNSSLAGAAGCGGAPFRGTPPRLLPPSSTCGPVARRRGDTDADGLGCCRARHRVGGQHQACEEQGGRETHGDHEDDRLQDPAPVQGAQDVGDQLLARSAATRSSVTGMANYCYGRSPLRSASPASALMPCSVRGVAASGGRLCVIAGSVAGNPESPGRDRHAWQRGVPVMLSAS